jgi:hypothetical protein
MNFRMREGDQQLPVRGIQSRVFTDIYGLPPDVLNEFFIWSSPPCQAYTTKRPTQLKEAIKRDEPASE